MSRVHNFLVDNTQFHLVLLSFECISCYPYHIFRREATGRAVIHYPKRQSSSEWKGDISANVFLPQAGTMATYIPVAHARGAPT